MNEVTQGSGGARRGLMKGLEEVSAKSNDRRFDCGSANVDANCQCVPGIGESGFLAHNGLCIIPTLCNSTGHYGDDRKRAPWQDDPLALPLCKVKEQEIIRA